MDFVRAKLSINILSWLGVFEGRPSFLFPSRSTEGVLEVEAAALLAVDEALLRVDALSDSEVGGAELPVDEALLRVEALSSDSEGGVTEAGLADFNSSTSLDLIFVPSARMFRLMWPSASIADLVLLKHQTVLIL